MLACVGGGTHTCLCGQVDVFLCVCMLCICMCVCCMSVCMHLCPSLCGCVHVHIFVWMCVMCSFGAIEMTGWLKLMSKRRKMTFYLFIFKKSSINYLQGCETRGFWPIALNQDE